MNQSAISTRSRFSKHKIIRLSLFVVFFRFFFFYFATNLFHILSSNFKIQLWNDAKNVEGDVYRLPFGIRLIHWNSTGVYINGKSVYFKGFGRHEDANVNFLYI